MIVFLLVVLLLVALSASTVMADKPPGVGHNGGCVAHCARTAKVDRPDSGDGKAKNCLADTHCITHPPADPPCGEVVIGDEAPCLPTCRVIHGPESHGKGH